MANLDTDIYTAQTGNVRNRPEGHLITGKVCRLSATYTTTGDEADNDVLRIAELPIGAILIPHLCRVGNEATGGTGTSIETIGDATDADRYSATEIVLTSAASTTVTSAVGVAHTPYEIEEDNTVITGLFNIDSGSVTAGKKIHFELFYLLP